MNASIFSINQYSYAWFFSWILADELGLPTPCLPALIGAGVLCGLGKMSFGLCLGIALLTCAIGDAVWYSLGRKSGGGILRLLCKVSLEPDSCVRKTATVIEKHGPTSLLFAKFLPGIGNTAVPMAGSSGMKLSTFALYDFAGNLLFVSFFLGLGVLLKDGAKNLESFTRHAEIVGVGLLFATVGALLAARVFVRWRFRKDLKMARIAPSELLELVETGKKPFIVDLRHPLDFLPNPQLIPTALRIEPSKLVEQAQQLPRDRDIILYCTCPNEATAASVALNLRQLGISRVRPLEGGFFEWRDRGFPLEEFYTPAPNLAKGHRVGLGA